MGLEGRYQILEMLSDGESRTYRTRQISSGRIVLLHQLMKERTPPNHTDLASLVFKFLRRATAEEMKILVDMGEEAGRVFVVTEDLPGFQNLRQGLESTAGMPGAAGEAGAPKPVPSAKAGPVEKPRGLPSQARQEGSVLPDATLVFDAPKVIAEQPPASPKEARPGAPAAPLQVPLERPVSEADAQKTIASKIAPSASPAAKEEPGEFTKIFFGKEMLASETPKGTSSSPEKSSAPLTSAGGKPSVSSQVVSRGEFEGGKQQARGPGQPPAQKPLPGSAPSAGQDAPGEFTRIFYGQVDSKTEPPSPRQPVEGTRPAPPAPEPPSPPEGAGEFTKLFQTPKTIEKPPAAPQLGVDPNRPLSPTFPPTEEKEPGEFTRLFRPGPATPRSTGFPVSQSSPQASVPLSSSQPQQGPGELTRLIQGYQPGRITSPPAPIEPTAPVVPPSPPQSDTAAPGEFTRIFQQPLPPASPLPPAVPSRPVAPIPPPAAQSPGPGEYTRIFEPPRGGPGASPQAVPPVPPPAQPQAPAGRGVPVVPMAPPVVPGMPYVQPPVVSVSPPVAPSMPYVQPPVVSVSPPVAPSMPYVQPPMVPQPQPYQIPTPQYQQPAVPAPPQAAAPKPGKKRIVPIIILGGLFVIAVVVILIFALRH